MNAAGEARLQERRETCARLCAFLAEEHTSPECPREPAAQSPKAEADAIWFRSLLLHLNPGGGKYLYRHAYTCLRCGVERIVES